jgi:hypothetical protein
VGQLEQLGDALVREPQHLDEQLLGEPEALLEDVGTRDLQYVSHAEECILNTVQVKPRPPGS